MADAVPGPVPAAAAGPVPDVAGDVDGLLHGLHERPLTEHLEAYDAVHRRLQEALGRLDGA